MTGILKQAWERLEVWGRNSLFGRMYLAIGRFFKRLIKNSLLFFTLTCGKLQDYVAGSVFYKILCGIFYPFTWFYNKWGKNLAENSRILRGIHALVGWAQRVWENSLCHRMLFGRDKSAGRFDALWGGLGIMLAVGAAPFLPTMALAGLLVLLIFVLFWHMAFTGKYRFTTDSVGVLLAAFVCLLLFFGVTSYAPGKSTQIALLQGVFVCSFFLILIFINSKERLKAILFIYCTSALLTGLIGLYQYVSGQIDVTWTDTTLFEDISLRVYSTFENPNVYGEYLLLAIPLAVAMFFISKRLLAKTYYAGITAVLVLALGLTYSRGCYLALLVGAAAFIICCFRKVIVFGVLGVLALPFVLPQSVLARFASITNLCDTSTSYRINIWEGTVKMLGDFWWLGIGLGQEAFNSVYPKYSLNNIVAPHAHNLYLQMMSETSIAGLVVFLLALLFFANLMIRGVRGKERKAQIFFGAMLCGIIAFLFQGIFDYVFYNYRVVLLFFMTLGIGCAAFRLMQKGENLFD